MVQQPPPQTQQSRLPTAGANSGTNDPTQNSASATVPTPPVQLLPTPFSRPFGSLNDPTAPPLSQQQTAPPLSQAQTAPMQGNASHQGRASNADDSDAEVSGIPRASGDGHLRRGRGRGPPSQAGSTRHRRDFSPESEGEVGDGYEGNRQRRETNAKLSIKHFAGENKDQDFALWVEQFEAEVNRCANPHSKRRHDNFCRQWLPTRLSAHSYAIWQRATHRQTDWEELKKELILAYEDPTVRAEWRTNMKALLWDEHNETLQAYCAKVMRCVDIFDKDIATTLAAKRANYYLRFVNGLPGDYNEQVRVSNHKEDIDKAMGICVRYQGVKKTRQQESAKTGKPEVAAAATYEDSSTPSRVTYNETDIQRLTNRVRKLEEQNSGPTQTTHNGHQSRHSTYQNGSNHSGGRQNNNNAGHSPYPREQNGNQSGYNSDRTGDRMKRWINYKQNFRGRNYRGQNSRGRNFQNRNNKQPQAEAAASATDEGLALQPDDDEEEDAGLDDTCAEFAAYMEMKGDKEFLKFCEAKDQAESENA